MKVLGIVAEYNPFHFGHKYHVEHSKLLTNAEYSIAIMSGSFVQRGEPSIIDKWTKAKIAIDNGVDLVIELPIIFSTQSAELFAHGSISLLNSLNIVNYISFGSELGSLNYLEEIANILIEEPPFFNKKLKEYLNLGNSYPISRSKALVDYYTVFYPYVNTEKIKEILKASNNILAIEYLKSLKILNSDIQPITIKRIGSSYGETSLNKISSATGIRNALFSKEIDSIKEYVPKKTFSHLINYINKYNNFNTLDNYNQIIHYLLNIDIKNIIKDIKDVEAGLENRIFNKASTYKNISNLIEEIATKRYTKTRIQRIFIHLMLGLTNSIFNELLPYYPAYIRVLGANDKGTYLLKNIKEKSNVPIITKFAHYNKYNNAYLEKMISFDKRATDLFFLGLNNNTPYMDMDFYISPYIKK